MIKTNKHEFVSKTARVTSAKISPEKAEFLLGFNTRNRPEIKKHTNALTEQMTSGKYVGLVSDIVFDFNGTLIDGQHTLFAIKNSKLPQLVCVKMGFPPETIAVIDNGKSRTPSVRYALTCGADISKPGQQQQYAYFFSVARMMCSASNNFSTRNRPTDDVVFELLNKHIEVIQLVCPIKKDKRKGFKRSGFRAAVADYFLKDSAATEKFYNQVTGDGAGIFDSALLKMREYLFNAPSSGGEGRQVEDYQKTVFCIHKYRNKESVNRMYAQKVWEF